MTTIDKDVFAEAMKDIAEVFQVNITARIAQMYFEALDDADGHDVTAAIKKAIRFCRFFPKPAEIREFLPQRSALFDPIDVTQNDGGTDAEP